MFLLNKFFIMDFMFLIWLIYICASLKFVSMRAMAFSTHSSGLPVSNILKKGKYFLSE